jgi:hypothetical protein
MSTKFFYALVLTICATVFQLILFFTGLQTENLATGQYVQWLAVAFDAVVLWLGIKAVRDEQPGRTMTYGQRLGAGVVISLYSGLMSSVYTYLHFKFINVNFADYTIDMLRGKWAAAGLGEAQMAQAEKMTRMMLAPGVQAMLVPVFAVVIGTLLSLIIAALIEGRATPAAAGPDPAT